MIQQKRLMDLFAGLVSIDNPSLHEAEMCARLKEELRALGAEPREDDTAAKIGGNAGNLYAYFEGEEGMEPLLLSAHMDSVEPACGKPCSARTEPSPPMARPCSARTAYPAWPPFWRRCAR